MVKDYKTVNRYKLIIEKQRSLIATLDCANTNVTIEEILVEFDRPKKILYVPGNERNKERLFVLEENVERN